MWTPTPGVEHKLFWTLSRRAKNYLKIEGGLVTTTDVDWQIYVHTEPVSILPVNYVGDKNDCRQLKPIIFACKLVTDNSKPQKYYVYFLNTPNSQFKPFETC